MVGKCLNFSQENAASMFRVAELVWLDNGLTLSNVICRLGVVRPVRATEGRERGQDCLELKGSPWSNRLQARTVMLGA